MILNKHNTLEFTLDGVKDPVVPEGADWEFGKNYGDMKDAIDNMINGAKAFCYNNVNLYGGDFNVCFFTNDDSPALEDDEIGIEIYSGELHIASFVVDTKTVFILKETIGGMVVLKEK